VTVIDERRAKAWAACVCVLACCLSHAAAQSATQAAGAPIDPAKWRPFALQRAVDAASAVADPYRRAETFASIAKAQVLIGESPHKSIVDALAAADKVSQAEFKGWVLQEIVLAQLAADEHGGGAEHRGQNAGPHLSR
jgi:hypothetical protein